MLVKEYYNKITRKATLVKEHASLETVVEKIAKDPKTRSVYVINENEELIGVIPVNKVIDFLGQKFRENGPGFIRDALAREAMDLMENPVSVSPDTPIEQALEMAINNELEEIPVCENKKVVGDLSCFEMIQALKESD